MCFGLNRIDVGGCELIKQASHMRFSTLSQIIHPSFIHGWWVGIFVFTYRNRGKTTALDCLTVAGRAVLILCRRAAGQMEIIFYTWEIRGCNKSVCEGDAEPFPFLLSHTVARHRSVQVAEIWWCISFASSLVIICKMMHHCLRHPNEVLNWKLSAGCGTKDCYITSCLLVNTTALILIALND